MCVLCVFQQALGNPLVFDEGLLTQKENLITLVINQLQHERRPYYLMPVVRSSQNLAEYQLKHRAVM